MILQNVIFSGKLNINSEIYFRASEETSLTDEELVIPKGDIFCSDTYMNTFDIGTWKMYMTINDVKLRIRVQGI